jgi:hypothetical protein
MQMQWMAPFFLHAVLRTRGVVRCFQAATLFTIQASWDGVLPAREGRFQPQTCFTIRTRRMGSGLDRWRFCVSRFRLLQTKLTLSACPPVENAVRDPPQTPRASQSARITKPTPWALCPW